MSDKDREALLEKNFTPEQRVCLDYVAERAAVKVIDEHGTRLLYNVAGRAALGMLVLLVALGAIAWGAITKAAGK